MIPILPPGLTIGITLLVGAALVIGELLARRARRKATRQSLLRVRGRRRPIFDDAEGRN